MQSPDEKSLHESYRFLKEKSDDESNSLVLLNAILETAVDGIIIINPNGIILEFNKAAEEIFQYKKEEIIGKNISILMPESIAREHDRYIARYMQTGEKNIIGTGREVTAIDKQGMKIPIYLSVSEMNINGEIYFSGMIKDISKLKYTEYELKNKQASLELALQAASAGSFYYDIKNDIAVWDAQCYKIFSVPPGQVITNQLWENCIYPEDFKDTDRKFADILDNPNTKTFTLDYRIIQPARTDLRHIETKGEILRDANGKASHILGLNFDITDKIKIREELEKSEKRLRRSQRLSKLGNWELDMKTGKMWWSEEIQDIFGRSIDSMPRDFDDFMKCIHHDDSEKINLSDRLMGIVDNYDEIYRIIRPDGSERFIHEIGEIHINENMIPDAISGTMQDITDLVLIEEKLRQEKERAERYLDLSESIIIELNLSGELMRINNRGADLLGYQPHDLIGRNWFDTVIPESGKQQIKKIHNKLVSGDLDNEYIENSIVSNSGEIFHIFWHNSILKDSSGKVIGTMSSGKNLTEQKEIEDNLKTQNFILENILQDNTPENILELTAYSLTHSRPNVAIIALTMNDMLKELTLSSAPGVSDSLQKHFVRFQIPGNGYPCVQAAIQKERIMIDNISADPAWKNLREHLVKEGYHASISEPILSGEGNILGVFNLLYRKNEMPKFSDMERLITASHLASLAFEKKKTEQDLIRAKVVAENASRAKSDFLSSMSHELRTPLNAILGFSQLLLFNDELNQTVKTEISEIHKAGELLLTLINDILDLSKIESGKIKMKISNISLNAVITECHRLMLPLAEGKNIAFKFILPDIDVQIQADYIRLKQIFLNLLSNAIKYNKVHGSVELSVSAPVNNLIQVSISDTGQGISEQNQSLLFDNFNRLDAEHTEIEGTGIGLIITKKLIEMMGGRIGFVSLAGKGSTFWITIPILKTS